MSRRGLLIALIVSLAVNLFVLGGLAGAALMGFRLHGAPPPGPPRLAALGEALTPAQREAWQTTVRQAAQTSGPKIREARNLRRLAWLRLTTDPVDPRAVIAELDQSRAQEQQARAEMDRAVVGFAATLPADERRRLGEALNRARPHGPHERWSGGRPAPGEGGAPPFPDR